MSPPGKNAMMQFVFQLVLVKPDLRATPYFVAVVDHETCPVGMSEIIERRDLVVTAICPVIEVVAELIGGVEINQIQPVFVPN